MRTNRAVLGAICLALVLGIPTKSPGGPADAAFSDPSVTQEMPEGWADQPLQYDPSAGKADIVVNLNRQVYQALHPLIEEFGRENDLKIVVTKGTCGITAGMLKKKTVDIGMMCCPPGKSDRLPGLTYHTVGIMSLALLVHPDNPIENISFEEARRIFRGDISRWSEITDDQGRPGKNIPIQVIARRHCKKRPGHWRLLLEDSDLFSPKLQEVGAIPDMIQLVASNPAAIGYEVMQMTVESKDKGTVKPVRINGVNPLEAEDLIAVKYPLYRTYSLTTWEGSEAENPYARRLVEYLLAQSGQVDPKYGLITVSSLKEGGWRFAGNELIGQPN